MSGIEKPLKLPLLIKRGKSAIFTVQPLKDAPAPAASTEIPAEVKATAAKAKTDGNLPQYLAWLKENNHPAHIINYVEGIK